MMIMPSRVETRMKIKILREFGFSIRSIASKLSINKNTVQKWIQRDSLKDKRRPGRPLIIDSKKLRIIVDEMCEKMFPSLRKTALLVDVSYSTVRRALMQIGIRSRKLKNTMVRSKDHERRRKIFKQFWMKHDLAKITWFSDEKIWRIKHGPNRSRLYWYSKSIESVPTYVFNSNKKSPGIMTWSMVSWDCVHKLVFLNDRVNSKTYTDMLGKLKHNIRTKKWILQDNAPAHRSKHTMNWMRMNTINVIPSNVWPPYSPDLNPIEYVWAIVQDRLSKRLIPNHLIKYQLNRIWNKLPGVITKACIDHVDRKIRSKSFV